MNMSGVYLANVRCRKIQTGFSMTVINILKNEYMKEVHTKYNVLVKNTTVLLYKMLF